MKKLLILTICLFAVSIIPRVAEAFSAEHMIAETWLKFRRANTEKEVIATTVKFKDGRIEKKALVRYTQYDGGKNDRVIIKFTEPTADRGTGLFIKRNPNSEDEMWLKLTSMSNVRKLSTSDQSKYFGGLDLTYEDNKQLPCEMMKNFDYTFISGAIGKDSVILANPKPSANTAYGKREIFITKDNIVTGITYYDKAGKLMKKQTNSKIVTNNHTWRADLITIENYQLKRTTTIEIKERQLNPKLSDSIFSKDYLLSEKY